MALSERPHLPSYSQKDIFVIYYYIARVGNKVAMWISVHCDLLMSSKGFQRHPLSFTTEVQNIIIIAGIEGSIFSFQETM